MIVLYDLVSTYDSILWRSEYLWQYFVTLSVFMTVIYDLVSTDSISLPCQYFWLYFMTFSVPPDNMLWSYQYLIQYFIDKEKTGE
jgi:hypothetical protein